MVMVMGCVRVKGSSTGVRLWTSRHFITDSTQLIILTPTDHLELPVTVRGGQRTWKESTLAQESMQTVSEVGDEQATLLQKYCKN